jgi:nucleoside-diphosphate-sugar epimerase
MLNILLTGASGTVGQEVLKQLCEAREEYHITVFDRETRSTRSFLGRYGNKCRIVYGDLRKRSSVSGVCSNQDIVIHLAAIIPPLADKNPDLAQAVNVGGTANLVSCIEELSPDAFFLYSSSISVYGDRNANPWIKTSDPLTPSDRDEYARTKIAAERIVTSSRLKWGIFRLTAIMGVNNHKISGLMFHMPLGSCMEIATPADTGRAFVNALKHTDELKGKIYNLAGGEKCRIIYKDFLSRSFKISGLGDLNFRESSFAGKNFHCGYYEDGDLLNDILDFRRETLEDYFRIMKENTPRFRMIFTMTFRGLIKKNIQNKSEPLAAMESNNKPDIDHYF